MRVSVAYYITGHGLGHATRSMELIRALLSTHKYIVHVVSQVSATFFTDSLKDFGIQYIDLDTEEELFVYHNRNLDTGAVQADVFVVDAAATLVKYHDQIHLSRDNLVTREVEWLQSNNIQLVLCDAIPLGCRVGRLSGATTILLSNFSWDFCFKEMLAAVSTRDRFTTKRLAEFAAMVAQCEEDSSCCDLYLQLPGQTPLPTGFPLDKVLLGPLIARQPRNRNLRSDLGINADAKVLLVGFGGHSAQWSLMDCSLPDGWVCLVLGAKDSDLPSERFRAMPQSSYVPDLIHCADAVLGKLGYGFVSECVTCGTALIYVPRVDWPEEPYLEKLVMDSYEAGVRMPREAFVAGGWQGYIQQAVALKGSWLRCGQHDFTTASAQIVEILERQVQSRQRQAQLQQDGGSAPN